MWFARREHAAGESRMEAAKRCDREGTVKSVETAMPTAASVQRETCQRSMWLAPIRTPWFVALSPCLSPQ